MSQKKSPAVPEKSIQRIGFKNFVLPLLGHSANQARTHASGLSFLSGNTQLQNIDFLSIERIEVISGYFWTQFKISSRPRQSTVLVGFNADEVRAFASNVEDWWKYNLRRLLDERCDELISVYCWLETSASMNSYIAASEASNFLSKANDALLGFPKSMPSGVMTDEEENRLSCIRTFTASASEFRDRVNYKFMKEELKHQISFFDNIEANPLTSEQRTAVATDENATLVLAAAGSGKTSVIVSKTAYLVETKKRPPDEILLLSFGRDAADEMAERVATRTGHDVMATTFHALGLTIIGQSEDRKPALAAHADDDKKLLSLIRGTLKTLIDGNEKFEITIRQWFSEHFAPYRNEFDFKNLAEYYRYVRDYEFRTLQGEKVKSFEECEIANFLYMNGVAYEYEPDYEHDTSSSERRVYTPDFLLTEKGIYLEHFGVGREVGHEGQEQLVTAPYIDRDQYIQDMRWKIALHEQHQTKLLQTFSYEKAEGCLTKNLHQKLLQAEVEINPIPSEKFFTKLVELGKIDPFTKLIATFLHHFKANKLERYQCESRTGSGISQDRNSAFLDIFMPVYESYQTSLGTRIDFEDMIVRAINHVETDRFKSPYRHILVDEFQDVSSGRGKLLKALLGQFSHSRLFAVGDDWQSIYRFAGSDLSIMRNFGREFGRSFDGQAGIQATVDLGRTFRCPDKIAEPATRFILKNDKQIRKRVSAVSKTQTPAVKIVFTDYNDTTEVLREALKTIHGYDDDTTQDVKLLGRYNHLKPEGLNELNEEFQNLDLGYMSIHRAKGLESDHVVVLGMNAGRWGFPSEIVDDPVLNMVLPEGE
ncbi:MAG: UvrD-helicase domain-containing protein, partial [Nitrospinae bacterium]|nr:UvrD-helicase domain-containing protein [Nitrospinota bacterium]